MQDLIDSLKQQIQEETSLRKQVQEKSKNSFNIIDGLQDKIKDYNLQILNHKKSYLELKKSHDASMAKFHDMTRAIQTLRYDNDLLYKHKGELEKAKADLTSDLTEKSKYILRLEKDLNNLGLRLKYNQKELQEKQNELSKLDFREKQTVQKLEQVMKDQEEI